MRVIPSAARDLLVALVFTAVAVMPAKAQQVRFERTGYRLTSIGERSPVVARVYNASRQPVAGARIRYHIADSTIATVSSGGIVTSRHPGYTKLWAVAGNDSVSALILVDQWAAKFDFTPSTVRFDAVGSSQPLRVLVRDAAGHLIPDASRRTTQCRSMNERVARLEASGAVTARANGITWVRCSDRGVADSVRIEVRQRPVKAVIAEKPVLAQKFVGDTFQIRLSAQDRVGDEIRDVQATWASLSPSVLSVDPLSGKARGVAPGLAKIVAQVGDVTDTVSITVSPGAGMPMPVADTASGLSILDAPRVPTLALQPLYLMVGDTGRATAVAKDAAGNTISNPGLIYRSSDTTIVAAVATRQGPGWVARHTGVAYVVAQFGSIVDSLQVSVRNKGAAAASFANSANAVAFERPRFDTAAARRVYAQRLDSAARAIKRASIVKEVTGRMLSVSGYAGQVAHAAHLSKMFTERRSGLMYGGSAELAPFNWIQFSGDFRTGSLSTNQATGEDMTVSEVQGDITFSPVPWFGFGGGYVRRMEQTQLATQRWEFPRVSAMARFPFVGGAITSVTGISVLPGASYTGYIDSVGTTIKPNPFSLAGEAGLELRTGVLSAALTYYVERFTFPVVAGEERRDQFSTLRLRVGLQAGR
ncbi:MAG TPA: hypothetical protein VKH19_10305 [Gemmatimonadaceae bacterium]|nr:hypothetical protein [Gemmatimonadaceae bacterium]